MRGRTGGSLGGRVVNTRKRRRKGTPPIRRTPPCVGCHGTTFWDDRPRKAKGELPSSAPDLRCADKKCRRPLHVSEPDVRALSVEGRPPSPEKRT